MKQQILQPDEVFVQEALDRFKNAEDAEQEFRRQASEDLHFLNGDQWDTVTVQDRQNTGRPCLTFNMLPSFVQQVTNELRQNRPSLQVDPVSDKSDEDTAMVYSGLLKHIEVESNADTQYDQASWYQVVTGLGYLRVTPEYESEDSFDQVLKIQSVSNPECVFYDPNSSQPDGSDAEYAFVIEDMPIEEFRRKFPNSELAATIELSGNAWKPNSNTQQLSQIMAGPGWVTEHTIRVAEYFYKEYERKTLYHLLDNRTGIQSTTFEKPSILDLKTEIIEDEETGYKSETMPNITILNEREVDKCQIRWCKINGQEILEQTDFPGKYIPIVPVKGHEFTVNGKTTLYGLIKNSKDAQKSYNFHANLQMELVDLAPKAPWVGATGQFDGKEHMWRDANITNYSYLEYNPIPAPGNTNFPLPPPTRQSNETPIQAVAATRTMAHDDLKAITGLFDASMGQDNQQGPESGIAVLSRQNQSKMTNYHFYDNLCRSIKQIGRILVKIIPYYYDAPRMIRIVKPDNTSELIAINNYVDQYGVAKNKPGKTHDLTSGDYDVVIDTGPSFQTKRQESVEAMMTLGAAYPEAMPLIADIMASQMDWPGAREIAKRLKTAVPQAVLQATGEGQDPEVALQAAQQQLQQATAEVQKLQAFSQELHAQLQAAAEENKLLKTKSQVDLEKAHLDAIDKKQRLNLDAKELEINAVIRQKELELAERELRIKEAELSLDAVAEMGKQAKTAHDVTIAHIDRMNPESEEIEEDIKNDSGIKD